MLFSHLRIQNFQSISDSGELNLGPITLLVGRNNTGKSAILRAVYSFQEGAPNRTDDIRLGSTWAKIELKFNRLPPYMLRFVGDSIDVVDIDKYKEGGRLRLNYSRENEWDVTIVPAEGDGADEFMRFPSREPFNLIYPSLARRHQQYYQQQPTIESASTISPQDSNLVARVAALATAQIPEAETFRRLCKDVLGFTVDVLLGQQQNQNQQLGIQVNRFNSVPLESMGAGVSGVLGLLVSLCDAKDKLFLIEELENDLHPQALKALLDAIIEASESNQFLISTHSSIVLTRLGAVPETVVLRTASDNLRLPTSEYIKVTSPEGRLELLRWLGYDLADLYLGSGWLIFEESSAERIIREWFIPWFAPSLRKLHTIGAKGASRVTQLAQALGEMLVFAHREPMYKHRAWVLVDGDEIGKGVVNTLRETFPSWPPDNFSHWAEPEFECYYPARFKDRVLEIRQMNDRPRRREMKRSLLTDLVEWIEQDPRDTAKSDSCSLK
jgi:predicted ATP-dependent endonuclease of OLD family